MGDGRRSENDGDEKGDSLSVAPTGRWEGMRWAGGTERGFRFASSVSRRRPTNLRQPQDGVTKLAPDQAEEQSVGNGGLNEVEPQRESMSTGGR